MSKEHGFDGAIRVGGPSGDLIGQLQSWNLDQKAETTKGSAMGQDWKDTKGHVKEWSGSAEAYFDPEDAGQNTLSLGDVVALDLYPGGNASGKRSYSGNAVVTGIPLSGSKDSWVAITFNFEGDGALITGTT